MNVIEALTLWLYIFYKTHVWLFVLYYLVTHVIYTYYFWASGGSRPILCMLPFYRVFSYREFCGYPLWIPIVFICITCLCYLLSAVFWGLYLIISTILEFMYARICVERLPVLYALCPIYKYIYLVKSGKELAEYGKE